MNSAIKTEQSVMVTLFESGNYPLSCVYKQVSLQENKLVYYVAVQDVFVRVLRNPQFFFRLKKEKVEPASPLFLQYIKRVSRPILGCKYIAQLNYDLHKVPYVDFLQPFDTLEKAAAKAIDNNLEHLSGLGYDFNFDISKELLETPSRYKNKV
jgi:hypothetical protein